ncbi:CLUMA_CG000618, isoform A [Clunio marinus]|uniref:CLUMA_CG000618, isoform A n=1 Tax=Clunio marinus TaxID=568069 RepID=A0A1J1HG00_9DIPT|nr:CLUMA_CG000618, isoform A [Clunio marinus]
MKMNHSVWSNSCSVYQRKLMKSKRAIEYQLQPIDVIYANAQSLNANFTHYQILCQEKSPAILMLSETHIKDFFSAELSIEGYKHISCDSDSKHTGGVIMYVRDDLCFNVVKKYQKSRTWILAVKISDSLINGLYTIIYKSPKEKICDFLSIIDEFMEECIDDDVLNVIVGDMNIDVSKSSKNTKKYLSTIQDHNLKQIVDDFTRVQIRRKRNQEEKVSKSIIDHILTNNDNISCAVNKTNLVSDHFMLELKINNRKISVKKQQEKILKNCWKKYSKKNLNERLKEIDWEHGSELNYDDNVESTIKNLKNSVNKLVVQKSKFKNKNEWFNEKIKKLKEEKKIMMMKYEFSKNMNDKKCLMKSVKKYKEAIKEEKCKDIQNKINNNKSDPKKLWKILKSMYSEKKSEIKVIQIDGALVNESSEIAESLNKFFIESVEKIVEKIPKSKKNNYIENININECKFSIRTIDEEELCNILKILKDKSYCDNLNGKVLIDAISNDSFATKLLNIVNESVTSGVVPRCLKTSTVTPIPKITNASAPEDFRPINNLPTKG